MSAEENTAISNEPGEALGRGGFEVLRRRMAPELAEDFIEGITALREAFPDYQGVNVIQIADGDFVANRYRYTGTHRGEFLGIAATGRQVVFEGLTLERFADGKVVEGYYDWEPQAVLGQLGAGLRAEPTQSP
jgi:predicted ester cyclase